MKTRDLISNDQQTLTNILAQAEAYFQKQGLEFIPDSAEDLFAPTLEDACVLEVVKDVREAIVTLSSLRSLPLRKLQKELVFFEKNGLPADGLKAYIDQAVAKRANARVEKAKEDFHRLYGVEYRARVEGV